MIQFNLLPDVKQEYIKAKRNQRLVVTVAVLLAGFCVFIMVVLFLIVNVLQKTHLNDINKDIKTSEQTLNQNTLLPKILTVQNQLKSIPGLMEQRPVTSRLFGYLAIIVPKNVSIGQLNVDFTQKTFTISGDGKSLPNVNQFVDSLKFTNYTTSDNTTPTKAFSNVVLTSFSRSTKGTAYSITLNFDSTIFDSSKNPKLQVPSIISTRSQLDDPLFQKSSKKSNTSAQGQ